MTTLICELRTTDGKHVGTLLLEEKTFRSGKKGYWGQGKLVIDDRRHQCQAQAVRIGPVESD